MPKPSKKHSYLTTPMAILTAFAVVSTSLLAYTQLTPMLTGALQLPSFNWSSNTSVPTKVGTNTSFGNVGTTPVGIVSPLRCVISITTSNMISVTVTRNGGTLGAPARVVLRRQPVAGGTITDAAPINGGAAASTTFTIPPFLGVTGNKYWATCSIPSTAETAESDFVTVISPADLIVESIMGKDGPTFEVVVKNQGGSVPPQLANASMPLRLTYTYNGTTRNLSATVPYNTIAPGGTATIVITSQNGYGTYTNVSATVNTTPLTVESPTSNNTLGPVTISINPNTASSSRASAAGSTGVAVSSCGPAMTSCYAISRSMNSCYSMYINAPGMTCENGGFYSTFTACDAARVATSPTIGGAGSSCAAAPVTMNCLVYSKTGFGGQGACVTISIIKGSGVGIFGGYQNCAAASLYDDSAAGLAKCNADNAAQACNVTATMGTTTKSLTLP